MLMKCPECELNVSDKALSCPHCGYPLQSEVVQKRKKRTNKNKRRRLPNGFGQISEIKNCNLNIDIKHIMVANLFDSFYIDEIKREITREETL